MLQILRLVAALFTLTVRMPRPAFPALLLDELCLLARFTMDLTGNRCTSSPSPRMLSHLWFYVEWQVPKAQCNGSDHAPGCVRTYIAGLGKLEA